MTVTDNNQCTVLITGALGGLGRAMAIKLGALGYRLALTDRTDCSEFIQSERLEDQVIFHATCHLENEQSVTDFIDLLLENTTIDILINNAALMNPIPFKDLEHQDIQRYMRVNVEAAYQLIKALAPGMSKTGRGRIINLVSGSAWQPPQGFVSYISSKMALIGMTRALAVELAEYGISVNALTPSLTRHAGNTTVFPEAFWDSVKSRQAIKRTGVPEDIVGAIAFLASPDSAFMTGQTVSVDGGAIFL